MTTPVPDYIDLSRPHGQLTIAQIQRLLKPIDQSHVENKRGMSYIAQFQARAELTRIFGFGNWDSRVVHEELLYESRLAAGDDGYPKNPKSTYYYVVAYKVGVELNIRDYWGRPLTSFVQYHAEENAPLPNRGEAHAMALTSAQSYAFRRAAIDLGDRLGLGLYDKGSTNPLVVGTLQLTDPDSPHAPAYKAWIEEMKAKRAAQAERTEATGAARLQAATNQG